MEIKDLMLDDLILTNDGQIAKVVSLYINHKGCGGDIIVDSDSKIFMSLVREEDINPIPLTEDILLKNGFVLRAGYLDGNEYILPGEDLYIFYEKDTKKMSVELGPRDIDILYVHQLQYLLRMCGLDELADNLKI